MMRYLAISVTVVTLALLAGSAAGQATRPAAIESAGPTTAPEGQAIQAKVESVAGSVLQRSASQGGAFKPVAKGDMLPGDTLIAVGCKGQAVLTFGDNSAVVLEQFTVMTIDKVYERQQAGKPLVVTRLKLVNGSVRAGVERGRTDSDFRVTTPVATLSVRGTRPIRIFYDSGAPELWFYLAREGWITGQLSDGGKTVDVKGGEGTNQTLTNTLLIAMFERHVQFGDPLGEGLGEFFVEVFNPNAIGNFGGGNPQGLGAIIQGGDRASDTSNLPPPNEDNFYGDGGGRGRDVIGAPRVRKPTP